MPLSLTLAKSLSIHLMVRVLSFLNEPEKCEDLESAIIAFTPNLRQRFHLVLFLRRFYHFNIPDNVFLSLSPPTDAASLALLQNPAFSAPLKLKLLLSPASEPALNHISIPGDAMKFAAFPYRSRQEMVEFLRSELSSSLVWSRISTNRLQTQIILKNDLTHFLLANFSARYGRDETVIAALFQHISPEKEASTGMAIALRAAAQLFEQDHLLTQDEKDLVIKTLFAYIKNIAWVRWEHNSYAALVVPISAIYALAKYIPETDIYRVILDVLDTIDKPQESKKSMASDIISAFAPHIRKESLLVTIINELLSKFQIALNKRDYNDYDTRSHVFLSICDTIFYLTESMPEEQFMLATSQLLTLCYSNEKSFSYHGYLYILPIHGSLQLTQIPRLTEKKLIALAEILLPLTSEYREYLANDSRPKYEYIGTLCQITRYLHNQHYLTLITEKIMASLTINWGSPFQLFSRFYETKYSLWETLGRYQTPISGEKLVLFLKTLFSRISDEKLLLLVEQMIPILIQDRYWTASFLKLLASIFIVISPIPNKKIPEKLVSTILKKLCDDDKDRSIMSTLDESLVLITVTLLRHSRELKEKHLIRTVISQLIPRIPMEQLSLVTKELLNLIEQEQNIDALLWTIRIIIARVPNDRLIEATVKKILASAFTERESPDTTADYRANTIKCLLTIGSNLPNELITPVFHVLLSYALKDFSENTSCAAISAIYHLSAYFPAEAIQPVWSRLFFTIAGIQELNIKHFEYYHACNIEQTNKGLIPFLCFTEMDERLAVQSVLYELFLPIAVFTYFDYQNPNIYYQQVRERDHNIARIKTACRKIEIFFHQFDLHSKNRIIEALLAAPEDRKAVFTETLFQIILQCQSLSCEIILRPQLPRDQRPFFERVDHALTFFIPRIPVPQINNDEEKQIKINGAVRTLEQLVTDYLKTQPTSPIDQTEHMKNILKEAIKKLVVILCEKEKIMTSNVTCCLFKATVSIKASPLETNAATQFLKYLKSPNGIALRRVFKEVLFDHEEQVAGTLFDERLFKQFMLKTITHQGMKTGAGASNRTAEQKCVTM